MIKNTVALLNDLINEVPQRIKNTPEPKMKEPILEEKWERIEILGHLCDSAFNNISRVIRAQFEEQPFRVIPYEQNYWVKLNDYKNQSTEDVVTLWTVLNRQFIKIISSIPEEKLALACTLPSGETKTLQWLIEDYLTHMEHHLEQIFTK
jgi:DinB superfamily